MGISAGENGFVEYQGSVFHRIIPELLNSYVSVSVWRFLRILMVLVVNVFMDGCLMVKGQFLFVVYDVYLLHGFDLVQHENLNKNRELLGQWRMQVPTQ